MNYKLTDLLNIQELKKLCESFSQLNNTSLAILDLEGHVLVAVGWQPICVQFHRIHPKSSIGCLESDTIIAGQLKDGEKFTMYTCKNGLVDVAMPIMVNKEHVGNFFTGQFFLKPPEIDYFKKQSKRLGYNEKTYLEALSKVPVFNKEEVKRTISFLVQLTEIIGNIGFKNFQNKELVKQLKIDKQELKDTNIRFSALNKEYISQNKELLKKEKQLEQINAELELLVELRTNELKETISKLKESNATKDRFFSIISHDLKSPVSQISQLSEMLEEDFFELSEEKKLTLINALKTSSLQGLKLLENLLEWSRTQAGAIEFKPANISIYKLVKENVELLKMEATDKNIQVILKIDRQSKILADANMISTVLRNLISNAIKFTYPGGKVEISHRNQSDYHEIEIKDNGKGMTKKEQKQLFKIDSGFSTLGTNEEKGTGLGLIICKEFISKHKGKIHIESKKGKGSEFIISLPVL